MGSNFHLACYSEAVGTVSNSDLNAAADEVFTRQNSHLIFTDDIDLLAIAGIGANYTRLRLANAALQLRNYPHIWPLERSATVPELPAFQDHRELPIKLPENEEILLEATTDGPAMGTANVHAVLWLGRRNWSYSIPPHLDRVVTRGNVVIAAGSANAWTSLVSMTFPDKALWNGVYAVVGAWVVASGALAFRFRFPDQEPYGLKQFRPGSLVQESIATSPNPLLHKGFGEWGRFHTFTPPEIQVFNDTGGGTYEVRLDLLYLGENKGLLRG